MSLETWSKSFTEVTVLTAAIILQFLAYNYSIQLHRVHEKTAPLYTLP